ncbi:TonB-dependent receptor [Oleiagrimonas sp. C23AA]|uniref:TonB-dependent receptor n=1 Tax=Oleiagrimonas sp. C23AA TaxID=2719047 RepID=UPI0014242879|nr:TonB-dependent receptor [Oleiagrimonas sp. C23AA]NII09684.1 TonB-dependent receptor [Oleiagrimonas sp. C23AA]
MPPRTGLPHRLTLVLAIAAILAPASALAGTTTTDTAPLAHNKHKDTPSQQLSTVNVTADTISAQKLPSITPLTATQPRAVIDGKAIRAMQSPIAAYTDVIALTPSVYDAEPNGSGMGNSKGLKIRGFEDGQFNLLMDGIPFGDANDFTHHSVNYFMPQDIGSVSVDRGPGNASTIGYATFGGTVSMNSRDPARTAGAHVYGTWGSFNTHMLGASLDTGTLHQAGDLRAYVDYRQMETDGYLSGANLVRHNFFFKAVKPLGEDTELTFASLVNTGTGSNSAIVGATSYPYVAPEGDTATRSNLPGQMQVFGDRYGLNRDPSSQACTCYNFDTVNTDLEYIRLTTRLGDVHVDNNLYTVSDYHRGWNGLDPNGGNLNYGTGNGPAGSTGDGTFPAGAGTPNGTYYSATNVPGQNMYMLYRNWGDTLRMHQSLGPGELKYGLWYNKQLYHRYQIDEDATNHWAWNGASRADAFNGSSKDRRIDGTFQTFQPYLQYDWNLTDALTVSGGLKYAWFKRHDVASVQEKIGGPQDYSQTWSKLLPAIDAHYRIADGWTAYVQAAKGYLAPNENLYYVPDPGSSAASVKPEQTTNYQIGTVWQGDRTNFTVDAYDIDFSNMVSKKKIAGVTYFQNLGGVKYRGLEVEGSYLIGGGLTAYANATYNKATRNSDGLQLKQTPRYMGSAALMWTHGAWNAVLTAKYTGANFGDYGTSASGQDIGIYRFKPNTITNLSVHYTLPEAAVLPRGSRLSLQVFNLADIRKLNVLSGTTAGNVPLFYATPGRSLMASFNIPVF